MLFSLLCGLAIVAADPGDDRSTGGGGRPADQAAYRSVAAQAGSSAEGQVRLALWCEAHGLTAERVKHLAAAVIKDPSNTLARGLLGLVSYQGKWERPEDVTRQAKEDPKQRAVLEEYLHRRARAAHNKVADQAKLAAWCDQNGLREQAVAHYRAVIRLDPRRDAAWKRLGFKRVGRRWIKPERQEAARREAEEQKSADRLWKPLLDRYRIGLSSRIKERRAEAAAALAEITDPRAVPMIWAVFVPRGTSGQRTAVQVLGQIDAPGSSRALALLALRSPSGDVRSQATQTLRQRDPRDFVPLLVALIRNPIKYDVKRVRGPGTTGVLTVKDGTHNRKRLYSPPAAPNFVMGPNEYLSLDANGLPVVTEYQPYQTQWINSGTNSTTQAAAMFGMGGPITSAQTARMAGDFTRAGLSPAVSQQLSRQITHNPSGIIINLGGDSNGFVFASGIYDQMIQIPIGEMIWQSQVAAQVAEAQLEGDVQAIQNYNAAVRAGNQQPRQILADVIGKDLGDDRSAWMKWMVDLFGYAYSPMQSAQSETTTVEQVPLAYQPQAAPVVFDQLVAVEVFHHSCFGAGTPVRTLEGLRPIESLRAGDLVLTQDTHAGTLRYEAVVVVYHNPPNSTYRIGLDSGESIVATGIHRLWKAGKGWTMVRELKPGDTLRSLGGLARVESVAADAKQRVYNLQVAEGESYFVGKAGVLAHDNSTINPVPEPFDAVEQSTAVAPGPGGPRHSMLGR